MSLVTSGTLYWSDGESRAIDEIVFSSKGEALLEPQELMGCQQAEKVDKIVIDYTWQTQPNTITLTRALGSHVFEGVSTVQGRATGETIFCHLYRRLDTEVLLFGDWNDGRRQFQWWAKVDI